MVYRTKVYCCHLPSHVVALAHSFIQNGWTALKAASFHDYHKVVELLLGTGANPDIQSKVRAGQNNCVHVNLCNGK